MATAVFDARRPSAARRGTGRRAVVAVALGLILVGGAVLRFNKAEHPAPRLSEDAQAYTHLAFDLHTGAGFGDSSLHQPFHWAPATPAVFAAGLALAPGTQRSKNP